MTKRVDIPRERIEQYLYLGLTYKEIADLEGVNKWDVMANIRGYGIRSNFRKVQSINTKLADQANSMLYNRCKSKAEMLDEIYKERINGMSGVNSGHNPHNTKYRKSVVFHNKKDGKIVCSRCGCLEDESNMIIYHVDEDVNNTLLSNLEPMCQKCYNKMHREHCVTPFSTITSTFRFDSAHFLPNHPKKCKFLHGHSYKLEVTIRRRIDPETGMVMDFGKIKETVKTQIEEVLDHGYINNYIALPTSENIILWIWMQLSFDVKGLYKLRLYETENNFSEIYQSDMLEFINTYDHKAGWLKDDLLIDNYKSKQEAIQWLEKHKNETFNISKCTPEILRDVEFKDKFWEDLKSLIKKYKEEENADKRNI